MFFLVAASFSKSPLQKVVARLMKLRRQAQSDRLLGPGVERVSRREAPAGKHRYAQGKHASEHDEPAERKQKRQRYEREA